MGSGHSDTDIVVHAVCATRSRAAVIDLEMEGWLRTYVAGTCRSWAATLLSFGASDDHVHLVVRVPPARALAAFMQQVKGGASHAWNTRGGVHAPPLHWQQGYWARSCEPSALDDLLEYVADQRARHARPGYREAWETPMNPPRPAR